MNSPGPLAWPTQTKKFLPKKFLLLSPKNLFLNQRNFSRSPERTNFYPKENFLYLPEKITNFLSKKISYTKFSKKKIFITVTR